MHLLYPALNLLQSSEFGLQVRGQKVQLRTYLLNSLNWQFGNCWLIIVIIIVQKCFVKKQVMTESAISCQLQRVLFSFDITL